MTEYADMFREAFESHEHDAPDAAVVLARAQTIARTYQRRRTGAKRAGGAVLGASLVAGGMKLPTIVANGAGARGAAVVQPAAGSTTSSPLPSPLPSSTPSAQELDRDLEAYFAAGYDLEAARKLAALWHMSAQPGDLSAVKAEAGRRVLAGETLPVQPAVAVENANDTRAAAAFFAAGYDYTDAQRLSALWKVDDTYRVKVMAGEKLLAGEPLPAVADRAPVDDAKEAQAVTAFLGAGYDYADAQRLATLWKTADAYGAKVMAGEKLLAGKKLPFAP